MAPETLFNNNTKGTFFLKMGGCVVKQINTTNPEIKAQACCITSAEEPFVY